MQKLQEAFESRNKKENKIEELKKLKTPLSVYERLNDICSFGAQSLSDEDSKFFLKCFGIFIKNDDTFMLRIRIPAGQLSANQAIKIGELSQKYAQDYMDITTREQIEFRFLKFEDIPTILTELDLVGITTFQTGVDNFRNIVTSSFDGLGEVSIIECKPIIDELQSIFLKQEEWIGVLPRKFNSAILGTNLNDCNIYGHDCSFIVASRGDKIGFNLYLGGKVGVQAQNSNLFIEIDDVVTTFKAIIELFKKYGFRDNRNRNRLHFLLEAVGMEEFTKAIKKISEIEYESSGKVLATDEHKLDDSGVFQLGENLNAVHFSIPSGIFKGIDLIKVGELTKEIGGEIRLSVEQSIYIITNSKEVEKIQNSEIYQKYNSFHNIYFNHQVACAGKGTCIFGVIPNKLDAIEMSEFLTKEVPIKNGKVRLYWSACPKGCGIHGVGDIGFEGCKVKDENGNSCDGVHIYIGGKATKEAKEARLLYKFIELKKAKYIVKKLMILYKNEKLNGESFESFDSRLLSNLTNEQIMAKLNLIKE